MSCVYGVATLLLTVYFAPAGTASSAIVSGNRLPRAGKRARLGGTGTGAGVDTRKNCVRFHGLGQARTSRRRSAEARSFWPLPPAPAFATIGPCRSTTWMNRFTSRACRDGKCPPSSSLLHRVGGVDVPAHFQEFRPLRKAPWPILPSLLPPPLNRSTKSLSPSSLSSAPFIFRRSLAASR